MFCYAGTTAERAQETLDVTIAELIRLAEGIEQRAGPAQGPHQELADHAAGILGGPERGDCPRMDHLGRARTLDEMGQIIDALTRKSINDFCGPTRRGICWS